MKECTSPQSPEVSFVISVDETLKSPSCYILGILTVPLNAGLSRKEQEPYSTLKINMYGRV